jgi:hypothetical protein
MASQHEARNTTSSTQSWHQSTRLATQHHQHKSDITTRGWQQIISTKLTSQYEPDNTSSTRSWHHNTRLATHHQHKVDITTQGWQHITTPPFEGGPFELHQAYLESAQTLHEIEAWSTHQ